MDAKLNESPAAETTGPGRLRLGMAWDRVILYFSEGITNLVAIVPTPRCKTATQAVKTAATSSSPAC